MYENKPERSFIMKTVYNTPVTEIIELNVDIITTSEEETEPLCPVFG